MDLNYAPEDLAFREAARQWFATNTPTEDLKTLDERKAWHRTMYEAGYVGMLWPKEYGGRGGTPMKTAIVWGEMGRGSGPAANNRCGIGVIGAPHIVHGDCQDEERVRQKILYTE